MTPFAIRLFGMLAAALLGGLVIILRPNPSAADFFEKGGSLWPTALMGVAAAVAGGLLVALIVRIGTPFLKGAPEIQLTGVALVLTAVLLGSSLLFMTLLFAV
jgi:hypothetical protein